jgi:hypothetical protein
LFGFYSHILNIYPRRVLVNMVELVDILLL